MKCAAHEVGQFVDPVRERRPFGDGTIDIGGAEHRPHVAARQRQPGRNDQHRHVFREGLRHARESVLDAGAGLRGEHAVAPSALDAGIAVGRADADPLLPAQYRPDIERGGGLDQRVAWIAGEKLGALALQDFGNDFSTLHGCVPLHEPHTRCSPPPCGEGLGVGVRVC